MQLIRHSEPERFAIRQVGADFVLIGEERVTGNVALAPDRVERDFPATLDARLSDAALELLLTFDPEIVLVGFNRPSVLPDPHTLGFFLSRRIGCEIMNLGAAARTYSVLASEGRRVVVALILR
jgi:uncharacterized protein